MKPLSKSSSAAVGEYLVLGEILKRGYPAFLAHGPSQIGWDIIVVDSATTNKIQVKTIAWPNHQSVNGIFDGDFNTLVIVLLDRSNSRSRFFVMTQEIACKIASAKNPKRGAARTITMSKTKVNSEYAIYEDSWDL